MLADIISEAAEVLTADPYFSDIAVITEDRGDLENEIEQALAKIGVCVILITPRATVKHFDIPGPYFSDILFLARVIESPINNRDTTNGGSGKKALDIAEVVLTLLHMHKPVSVSEALTARDPSIVLANQPNYLAYDVLLGTMGGIAYAIPKIALPAITINAGVASIACATPHVGIFYTLNDSYPTPRNTSEAGGTGFTFFYDAPFAVTPGQNIIARAYLAGYLPSNLARATAP